MTATAFLQLRAALVAHLAADPALAGVPVRAGQLRPIAQEERAAVNVLLDTSPAQRIVHPCHDWRTQLFIDCAARAIPGGQDADSAADLLLGAVYAAVAHFNPASLGVIDPIDDAAIRWDRLAEDVPYTCATLRITVHHRTPGHSLQPAE